MWRPQGNNDKKSENAPHMPGKSGHKARTHVFVVALVGGSVQ
jgi:hypothetical protein